MDGLSGIPVTDTPPETGGKRGRRATAPDVSNEDGQEDLPLSTLPTDQTPPRRRGRPPGSSNKRERNLQGMEQMLCAIHLMISMATGLEELQIDPSESHILADALANLSEHYKIKLDGKAGAVLGLIYAIGAVYGPRAVSIGIKIRKAKRDDTAPRT